MKPRPSAVEAARREASESPTCGWWRECRHEAVADVWLRSPHGVDRRPVCERHLTVATAIGYQPGPPPSDEAVSGTVPPAARRPTVWAAPLAGQPAPYPTLGAALDAVRPALHKHLEPGAVVAVAWPTEDTTGTPPLVLTPDRLGHLAWREAGR